MAPVAAVPLTTAAAPQQLSGKLDAVPRLLSRSRPLQQRVAGLAPSTQRRGNAVVTAVAAASAARSTGAASEAARGSNPIGVHAMVWVGQWTPEESKVAISKTAELGYDLIEVPVFNPESIDVGLTRSFLNDYGIAASASLGLTLDADISSADEAVSKRGEEALLAALKAASGFGATHLTGVTHSAIAKYPHPFPGGAARTNLVRGLRNVAARAADLGVVFGLEVINRYESNVLNTAVQAMELISEIDHPNVVVHLDSYHMNIEEGSLADAVAACGDRLGYVHIGECHRGYLGSGSVNFPELFRALARAGYTGPITFESFSSRVVSPALSNNLAVWRNLWDDSEDLARHAKSFMDSQWRAALRATT